MTIDELKQAHELTVKIDQTERLLSAYRETETVIVGTGRDHFGVHAHEVALSAAEIADQVAAVLDRRIMTMKAELQKLGVGVE